MALVRPRRLWRALVLCLPLALGLAGACGVPDYRFADPAGNSGGSDSGPSACASNTDCAALSATRVCDLVASRCVECKVTSSESASGCGEGLFCTSAQRCEIGCGADADCRNTLHCDAATARCVGCTGDADCGPGTTCEASICVPSCADATNCPSQWLCCSGSCANPFSDALNCQGCGNSCGAGLCIDGACSAPTCDLGFADCDGKPTTGCETDLRSSTENCGRCGLDCTPGVCSGGRCTSSPCPVGFADCDTLISNGCEANLADVTNCSMCGTICGSANGVAACTSQGCSIACNPGFANCDSDPKTGCETNTSANDRNCGDCRVSCTNDNGTNKCLAGTCQPTCAAGFADCDGNPVNGCETNLGTSLTSCGACGRVCNLAHASEVCDSGVCKVGLCEPGFDNCNGNATDGCESDLSQPDSCGSCTNKCSSNGGTAVCSAGGSCSITCAVDRADCANGASDGCEVDTQASALNCGSCGHVCPAAGGTPACTTGVCGISSCAGTLADCNGSTDGCETDLSNDATNCGDCGHACVYPNGVGRCLNKACVFDHCTTGFADCTAAAGCETPLGTTTNCTRCGEACTNAHGSQSCGPSGCQPTCALGFADCNNNPSDGCETPLNTLTNCGSCGSACGIPNQAASCTTGTCVAGACAAGFADCTAQAGCETPLGTLANCAACGDVCSNANGSTACSGGSCVPLCNTGWKSCDTNPKNGCETNVFTTTNCGNCGVACSFANAAASCASGTCTLGSCNAGFADCNAGTAGCETALGTTANCAGCGNACSNAHGTTSCSGAPGNFDCLPVCAPGWLSCDGDPDNGCELDVTTTSHCGSCSTTCAGSTSFCVSQSCVNPVVNSSTNGTVAGSGATLDISHTLQTGAGNGRLVVLLIAGDGNDLASATPTAVTYNAVSLTLGHSVWSANRAWSGIYYIKDANLPPAPGSYTVHITGSQMGKVANVIEFKGIDQTNPVLAMGGSTGANCATDDPSDGITTAVNNAIILTTVATFGSEVGTPSSGQITTFTGTDLAVGFKAGYLGPVAAGTRTVAWDMSSCNVSVQALLALKPASP